MYVAMLENAHRYKSDEKLPKGEYWILSKQEKDSKPIETWNKMPCIPFVDESKRIWFSFAVPKKPWLIQLANKDYVYRKLLTKPVAPIEIPQDISLLPWQQRYLENANKTLLSGYSVRRAINRGIGQGKTLPALLMCQKRNSVFIAPNYILAGVKDECKKWGLEVPKTCTYEGAKKIKDQPECMILDEALLIKNPNAARTRHIHQLAENAAIVAPMTGTPLSAKKALDSRWLLSLGEILPEEEKHFMFNFGINPHLRNEEYATFWDVDGWDIKKLSAFVAPYMDVGKADVTFDILYQKIYLPTPKSFYAILEGFMTDKEGHSKKMTQARTCTSGFIYEDDGEVTWLKDQAKIKWVKDFLESNPDEPVIIFSAWQAEQSRMAVELKKYNPANVTCEGIDIESEVTKFTSGETNVMICSAYRSEGMNLQRACIEIFMSNATRPDKREQAEGRIARIGQTRRPVIYDLICLNTLDERHLDLLKEYRDVSSAFVENLLVQKAKELLK